MTRSLLRTLSTLLSAGALLTMSTSRRSMLGLLGAASLTPLAAGRTGSVPKSLLPGGEFERFLAQRSAADQFSGTVLVAHRGHPVLTRSYGMADKSRSVPNATDTVFNLGSLTKPFTALAVAQLMQQDRLHPWDTIGTCLDGFSPAASQVTIHQLLTHTGGLGDYSGTQEFFQEYLTWRTEQETMDGILRVIRNTETDPVPSGKYRYSNSGFAVLGAIVATVSGESYYDYIRRYVLAPAGMTRSGLFTQPEVLAGRDIAHAYLTQKTGGRTDFTVSPNFGFTGGPANAVYSSVPDLLSFVDALRNGTLVNPAFASVFTSSKIDLSPTDPPVTAGQARFYGYGFRNTVTGGQLVFGHSGSGPGVSTNLDVFPGLDYVCAVLSNYDTAVTPVVDKARELITAHREH